MEESQEKAFVLDAIKSNRRRVVLAAFLYFLVVLALVFLLTLALSPEDMRWKIEMLIIFSVSIGTTLLTFPLLYHLGLRSSKNVLEKLFAPAVLEESERTRLRLAAEGVALAAGVPAIEVKAVAMRGINAISLGSGIDDAEILVSREAVERMDRGELEAVLAHEIYHIESGDTRLWALGTGLSGAVLLGQAPQRRNWMMPGLQDDPMVMMFNYNRVHGFFLWLLGSLLGIILFPAWIMYFIAVIPKSRDFLADEHALLLTKSPEDVARAIELSDTSRSGGSVWGGLFINHMLFNQPLEPPKGPARTFARLLNTHSPASERAQRIRSMG